MEGVLKRRENVLEWKRRDGEMAWEGGNEGKEKRNEGRGSEAGRGVVGMIELQFTPLSHLARSFSTQKA